MKPKMKKSPMEVLWICMAVMCLIIAIIRTISISFNEGIVMYTGSALCVLMFLWRRSLRKRDENQL
ncbi:MAG: hypothetical protein J6T70_17395 [Bacteroidales bacterium]|nr:hypothetical protein [Bacteroidales bacterium]MBQ3617034.1 hypothetical protein [Bacteroidales bacterium]MDD6002586.1 hypothetical protein [Bacteroidales bacterium]